MHHRARSPSARPRQQFPSVSSSSTAASALAPNPASLPRAFARPPRSSTPSPERKARSASLVRWTYRAIIAGMVAITSLLLLGSFLFSTPSYAVQESWRVRDASCPDYRTFSTRRHTPVTNGPLRLPFQRPISECRTFSSKEVERVIKEVTGRIPDVDLSRLFENCFPNTLDTTVRWHVPGRSPQSFIVTGDINAEWIRDSTNQLSPYLPLAKVDNDIRTLILGAIHTQAEFLTFSPYCNAFQPPAQSHLKPSSNDQSDNVNPPYDPSLVFECKYELDSLASFLNLANMYFEQTGDASFVGSDPYFLEALKNVLQVLDEQALTTYDENGNDRRNRYIFQRQTNVGTETLALQGAGNPTNLNTSLIRSAFRPSDDATILQFFIPANAFVAVELKRAKKLLAAGGYAKMADELFSRGEKIENGVWEHGVYEHKVYGKVFAYEVDGYGSIINMDDANLPSLLSLPLLGFVDAKDEVYQNTRRMLLSKAGNPYFLKGPEFVGIGGPHIGVRYAWPMSLLTLIRTSDDDVEIAAALDLVKKTTGGLGLMHESVNVRRARDYTRSWFAWCNSEFGKTILDLAARKPHLVFGEGAEPYSIDSVASA